MSLAEAPVMTWPSSALDTHMRCVLDAVWSCRATGPASAIAAAMRAMSPPRPSAAIEANRRNLVAGKAGSFSRRAGR
jgi:hypothetical protein